MARPAVALDEAGAERLGLVAFDELPSAGQLQGHAVPRRLPGVVGLAQQDADLLGVRVLRVDGQAQRRREAVGDEPAPRVAAADHLVRPPLALLAQARAAPALLHVGLLLEKEPMDAVEL